jgi:hypothetical protein
MCILQNTNNTLTFLFSEFYMLVYSIGLETTEIGSKKPFQLYQEIYLADTFSKIYKYSDS